VWFKRECLDHVLELSGRPQSAVLPANADEKWTAIMANSLFYDSWAVWQRNLEQIGRLLEKTALYRLQVGTQPAGSVAAVKAMMASS